MDKSVKDLWYRMLQVFEIGDTVRFKHGRTTWVVLDWREHEGRRYVLLGRKKKSRLGWSTKTILKTVWKGSREYWKLRIVQTRR